MFGYLLYGSSECFYETAPLHSLARSFSGPAVVKLFLCSTQLSIKFNMRINVKMPTIYANNCWHFNIYQHDKYNI